MNWLQRWMETRELKKQLNRIMDKPIEVWQVKIAREGNKGEVFYEEAGAKEYAKLLLKYGYPVQVRVAFGNSPASEWMDVNVIWDI